MLRLLIPDLFVGGVQDLTPERLRGLGLDSLLLDADCTLKRYGSEECTPEAGRWLAELRAEGFGACLVSNGLGGRIGRFAQRLDLPLVARALKPLPWGCRRAVRTMGFQPSRTAMVGDQVFADVMAAHLAGLRAILVVPIHPEEEPWFTRLKRHPERRLIERMTARGLVSLDFSAAGRSNGG